MHSLCKFLFYLSAVCFSFILLMLLLYSVKDQTRPKLRQSRIEHNIIPCGERELHDEMVQFISEYEPRYLHCLQLERENRKFTSSECHFGSGHIDMLRRLHRLRSEQEQDLNIVQIGAMDGKSNDPIFQSMYKPHLSSSGKYWPPYPLHIVHATLVEPVHMTLLKKQYAAWGRELPGMQLAHFQFVELAVSEATQINTEGKCTFYTPSPKCPLKIKWANQISGLNPAHMQKVFGNSSDICIEQHVLPCVSVPGLLRIVGRDVHLRPSGNGKQVSCDRSPHNNAQAMSDVLIIDAEGFDGSIISAALENLCSSLWPAIIIFEDKVLRSSMREDNKLDQAEEEGEEVDTEAADLVIDILEQHGYYVLLLGEDAIALRVGYSIDAMRHSLFDPPDLSIFRQKAWLHPQSSRTAVS